MRWPLAHDPAFTALLEHIDLSLMSLLIASALAFPTGILIAQSRRLTEGLLTLLACLYTIPSLAMLALLVPWLGLGKSAAMAALIIYAQFILLRHVVLGLQSVEHSTIEAARGLGMTEGQIFLKLKVPMALPLWINGLRNATLTTLSIATNAAWINAGGLGTLIFNGLAQNNLEKILTGALLISGLSLIFDYSLKTAEAEALRNALGNPF